MSTLLTAVSFAALALHVTASPALLRRGAEPAYYSDPGTTKYCSWWFDNESTTDCTTVPEMFDATFADFMRWNPLVDTNCNNFNPFQSYCVEAYDEPTGPPVTSSPSSSASASKTSAPPTTTKTGNGIVTPTPTQPGMVGNCNKFYKVVKDVDTCASIAAANGITVKDFTTWNTGVSDNCTLMWADAFQCVGVIGFTPAPTTTSKPASTTSISTTASAGNGITTPTPTQPGMVKNCNKFYKVIKDVDTCATIASKNGITVAQFTTWNTGVGSDCTLMWAETFQCVGVVGFTPTPTPSTTSKPPATTTKAGNGIATPTPTQPGMVANCNKFYKSVKDETCVVIASKSGITVKQFTTWNTGVKDDCSAMWADTFQCVGIVGFTPTPTTTSKPPATTTKAGNGITTPTPIQPGMVTNCDKFHYVSPGNVCTQITSFNKISVADFVKWNPQVKSDCSGMWADVYVCVSIIGV